MKASVNKRPHDCDKHLTYEWLEDIGLFEIIEYCEICGRVKSHYYNDTFLVTKYKPKNFRKDQNYEK